MAGTSSGQAGQASAGAAGRAEEEERRPKVQTLVTPRAGFVLTAVKCNGPALCPRRYRKMKERLGLTEIRKHANRMTFAEVGAGSPCSRSRNVEPRFCVIGADGWIFLLQIEDDAYQEDLGFSLGQLGKSGSGRVRQAQVNDATKARISKSLQVKPPPFPPVSYRQCLGDVTPVCRV